MSAGGLTAIEAQTRLKNSGPNSMPDTQIGIAVSTATDVAKCEPRRAPMRGKYAA